MLIPIHPADGVSPATWAMIELQGELERNGENTESVDFDVGTLTTSSTVSTNRRFEHFFSLQNTLFLTPFPLCIPFYSSLGITVLNYRISSM